MIDFYADSGLSSQVGQLNAMQTTDGAAPPVDRCIYLGDPRTGYLFRAASDPGVDQISVSIANSLTGNQIPASSVRLALTQGDLTTATPGAALDVGTSITSGPENAVWVWVRIDTGVLTAGAYSNLSLVTSGVLEDGT